VIRRTQRDARTRQPLAGPSVDPDRANESPTIGA
jgi:hypothetical protein